MIGAIFSNLHWIGIGVVIGVVFDEFFRMVWRKVRAKGKEVIDDVRS